MKDTWVSVTTCQTHLQSFTRLTSPAQQNRANSYLCREGKEVLKYSLFGVFYLPEEAPKTSLAILFSSFFMRARLSTGHKRNVLLRKENSMPRERS